MAILVAFLIAGIIIFCIIMLATICVYHKEIHFILKGLKNGLTYSQAKEFCDQVVYWDEPIEHIHDHVKSWCHNVVILSFDQFLKFYNIAPEKYTFKIDNSLCGTEGNTVFIYYDIKGTGWSQSYTNAIALAAKEDYYKLICWRIQEADKAKEEKRRKSDILCEKNLEEYLEHVKGDIENAFKEVDERLQEEKEKLKEMAKYDV